MKCCWGYKSKMACNHQENIENDEISKLKAGIGDSAIRFSFKELQKATNNFSTKLGIGDLSTCHKGTLENGTVVAVKVLRPRNADIRMYIELRVLINVMSEIRHQNVVEFIGCCVEDDHVIIVYEFMEGGSLASLLDDEVSKLSWPMRASICLGIARGLECLDGKILHRDIRPNNVLLDNSFNPKIMDFGIMHIFTDYASDEGDRIPKNIGYIDREYMTTGHMTTKGDVYAFGVVLLEVISGKRVPQFLKDCNDSGRRLAQCLQAGKNLVDWARQLGQDGSFLEIIDPTLSEFPEDEVKRFIDVALSCVRLSSNLRPSMSEVSLLLSGGHDLSKNTQNNPAEAW